MRKHQAGGEDEPQEAARCDQEVLGDLDPPELGGGVGNDHDGVELLALHVLPFVWRQKSGRCYHPTRGKSRKLTSNLTARYSGLDPLQPPDVDLYIPFHINPRFA